MQGALNVIGPPLGALLLAVLPFENIMLMDVGTAAFAILPLFFVAIPQPERTLTKSEKPSLWSDVREGLRYVWGWPGLLAVLIMATVINFVVNPAFSLMPLLVTEHFNGDAPQLAWLESSWGVGLVLGGLLLSTWGGFRRRVYTSLIGLMIEGLGITLVGLAPANVFWLAVAGMFVAGLRPWYVVGGIACTLMGLGACFVPVIVNIEQNHNGHNVGSETLPSAAVPVSVAEDEG
jgi:DHA3 family macrolide efflux protein-like MFS transporter